MKRRAVTIPNFAVGDNAEVLDRIKAAIGSVPGVSVLTAEMDPDHNRAVISAVGEPESLSEAVFRGARVAVELIDLNRHRGVHPRIGAVDVVPFVPYEGVTVKELVDLAAGLGQRLADELSIPVYLYGRAARSADRLNLSTFRNSGFEALKERIGSDPAARPDIGPAKLHPTAGATAVGVRDFLIAYNVVLDSSDLHLARRIARDIREASGGLAGLKALGLELAGRGKVQVSMTLNSPEKVGLWEAFQAVRLRAGEAGVEILESEIVGLVPLETVLQSMTKSLKLTGFSADKILEVRLD